MLAIYALAVIISGGLIGLFVRQILALLGFVPGLAAGAFVVLAVGSVFAAFELFFMAVLRLYRPTRDRAMLVTETISCFTALIFIPYLLHVKIPWPSSRFESVEPLIYFFVFAAMHLLVKLATFYASLEGTPSRRISAAGWGAAAVACGALAYVAALRWMGEAEQARFIVSSEARSYRVGDEFAQARPVMEGALLRGSLSDEEGQVLSLRLANLPDAEEDRKYGRAYLSVHLIGDETKVYKSSARLLDTGWAELRVPSSFFPSRPREYEVRWTRKGEPNWQGMLGIRPIVYNLPERPGATSPLPAKLLISGPSLNRERAVEKRPNFLVILVDGLGAGHVSMLGYEREVTPSLDRLGYGGLVFPNAYAREGPVAAIASLLTGVRQGDRGVDPSGGPSIAALLQAGHYATAAFSEAKSEEDADRIQALFGSGFDVVDVGHGLGAGLSEAAAGSRATLERARAWIAGHSDVTFFCVLRLRELEDPQPSERYETVYPEEGGRMRDVDLFDNALLHLDRQIGALLKYIRDHDTRSTTCIVVTSLFGHDFSLGPAGNRLTFPSERVPIILHVPGGRSGRQSRQVGLADVAATIAALAEMQLEAPAEGRNLLN